ncbi:nucleoside hydrolase [Patulibacter sp. NPDC049589]|uniref:nucleoside hydrolase n=1 Tax=Patulibacter sp. NPDC049589 TaxID=3154731 RepID=UPI00343C6454
MTRIVVDTDTASDDAVALVMALRTPGVEVAAVLTVAGNVPVEQATQNALYVLERCGATDVPVHQGVRRPLLHALSTAQHVHGHDGMGDVGIDLTGRQAEPGDACDTLIGLTREHPGVTLVALGPLTNIAIALLRDPELAYRVGRCVVMGGASDGRGNITPVAEYNFWADPHAAEIVMRSGLPLEIVGWDLSRQYATMRDADLTRLRACGPLGQFSAEIGRSVAEWGRANSKADGLDLADPLAMAVALDSSVARHLKHLHVEIDTNDGPGRGRMVVAPAADHGSAPNARVVTEASRSDFLEMLYASMRERA